MKKIISVVGARPNFMKVAPIHRAFEKYKDDYQHIIVHTGQHYDQKMSGDFFTALELPEPDFFLGIGSASHAVQTAKIMIEFEKILDEVNPDLVLVVGDVNSTVACALTSVKKGIKLAHVEAGLRSFDRRMPEEINRIVTDSISNFAFVTEESGKINLIKENFPEDNIFFLGNTMIDSLRYAIPKAERSDVLTQYGLEKNNYILITMHRPSNVDNKEQLLSMLNMFAELSKDNKIFFPVHPRTLKNIEKFGFEDILKSENIILSGPAGYVDFLALMMNSKMLITDSGGIQEETTTLEVPCITLRTSTERPVTCEIGTNILTEPIANSAIKVIKDALMNPKKGQIPKYWDGKAAERIVETIIKKIN
jgi:UDP-N-acetylglucosamine 2-epimerase (non-hydrolysing)